MNYEAETQWENDNQDVYIWLINDLSTGEKWLFWYSHKPGETAPFHAGSEFDEDHFELLKKYCYKYRRCTSVEEDIPNDCFVSLSFSWWNK